MHGLRDLRVIDLSLSIAGAYAGKLLADAGADVIKVEPPEGDLLRRWSATGAELGDEDGALFQFLHGSKRSIVGNAEDTEVLELIAGSDLLIDSFEGGELDGLDLRARFPRLVRLSITPYGRGGPYSGRPASDITIQAESGCIAARGLPEHPPVMIGGRTLYWVGGVFSAVAALAALWRARRSGRGEHIDFSLLELITIASSSYGDLMYKLQGSPQRKPNARTVEIPSVEPTLDGWVGFNTNSREQYNSFLLLIGRADLQDEADFAHVGGRWRPAGRVEQDRPRLHHPAPHRRDRREGLAAAHSGRAGQRRSGRLQAPALQTARRVRAQSPRRIPAAAPSLPHRRRAPARAGGQPRGWASTAARSSPGNSRGPATRKSRGSSRSKVCACSTRRLGGPARRRPRCSPCWAPT